MDARMMRFLKGDVLYVQIFMNRYKIRNITTGKDLDLPSATPFSHPRTVVGDFVVAEEVLKRGVKSIRGLLPPSVLMHPMDKVKGGLTQIEERAILELANGAGANKAALWTGGQLGDEEVRGKLG
jgi:hypothetical protein